MIRNKITNFEHFSMNTTKCTLLIRFSHYFWFFIRFFWTSRFIRITRLFSFSLFRVRIIFQQILWEGCQWNFWPVPGYLLAVVLVHVLVHRWVIPFDYHFVSVLLSNSQNRYQNRSFRSRNDQQDFVERVFSVLVGLIFFAQVLIFSLALNRLHRPIVSFSRQLLRWIRPDELLWIAVFFGITNKGLGLWRLSFR